MVKILMVCLGNICRSPLAEGIMRAKVDASAVEVDSAGTAAYHIGSTPDPRSIAVAKKYGIDISQLNGRQFQVEDFDAFDIIYAMDTSNFNHILNMARTEADQVKVKLILNELSPAENLSVPDPYYGGAQGFEQVYEMLDKACNCIAKQLI
jgi:protein-tyrosine phosphatase